MFNKKRLVVFAVFFLFMFAFITFAGGTPQNQAIATRNVTFIDSYNNSELSAQRVIVGEDAEVPENPKHNNLVFVGWYLEDDRDVRITDFTNITENISVVALYTADLNGNGVPDDEDTRYTVRFIDTTNNSVISTQEVLIGMDAVAPVVPSHQNMTFVGWSRAYTNVRSNLTIEGVWRSSLPSQGNQGTDDDDNQEETINTYSVTFVDGITNRTIAVVQVEEGLSANTPEAPEHENYVFSRWEGNYSNVEKDEVVTALYEEDSNGNGVADNIEARYVVNYYKGILEAEGEMDREEVSYLTGDAYIVLDNPFTLNKAVFIGWSTINPNKLIESKDEEDALNLVMPGDEQIITDSNVVYYAVWAIDENNNGRPDYDNAERRYNVSYESVIKTNLSGTDIETIEYLNGVEYVVAQNPYTMDKAVFIGWTTNRDNAGEIINTQEAEDAIMDSLIQPGEVVLVNNSSVTYYAVWAQNENQDGNNPGKDVPDYKEDKYSVIYNGGLVNEEIEDTNKYVLESSYVLAENTFELDKAIFIGWTLDKDIANSLVETKAQEVAIKDALIQPGEKALMGDSDVTYYAVWAKSENGKDVPDYDAKYSVTIEVVGGSANPSIINDVVYMGEVSTDLTINDGYIFDEATISCVNAKGEFTNDGLGVVVSDVENDAVCKVTYQEDEDNDGIADKYQANVKLTVINATNETKTKEISVKIGDKVEAIFDGIVPSKEIYSLDRYNVTKGDEANVTYKDDKYIISNILEAKTYEYEITLKRPNVMLSVHTNKTTPLASVELLEGSKYVEFNVPYAFKPKAGYTLDHATISCDPDSVLVSTSQVLDPKAMVIRVENVTTDTVCVLHYQKDNDNNDIADGYEKVVTFDTNDEEKYGELLEGNTTVVVSQGSTLTDAQVPTIKEINNDFIAFDRWVMVNSDGTITELDKDITEYPINADVRFRAIFGDDKNNNGVVDGTEEDNEYVTITFEVSEEQKALVNNGAELVQKVIKGANFAEVVVPEFREDLTDNITFKNWTPVLPKDTDKVEVDATYRVEFADDKNNNGIVDGTDEDNEYVTITFEVPEEQKALISNEVELVQKVIKGANFAEIVVPEFKEDLTDNITFKNWTPELPSVTDKVEVDATYIPEFGDDKNNNGIVDGTDEDSEYVTITFEMTDEQKALISNEVELVQSIVKGANFAEVVVPEFREDLTDNITFVKWTPELPSVTDKVEADVTYTPEFGDDKNNNGVVDGTDEDEYYSVTFNTNGNGTINGLNEVVIQNKVSGEEVQIPTNLTANEGYEFKEWRDDSNAVISSDSVIVQNANSVYTAIFEKKEFIVTYKNGDKVVATESVLYGDKINEAPANLTKAQDERYTYTFSGWTLNGADFDLDTVITGNVTLSAYFTKTDRLYIVKFVSDGKVVDTKEVKYEGLMPDAPTATKTDYTFITWKTKDGKDISEFTNVTKDLEFVAEFEANMTGIVVVPESNYSFVYKKGTKASDAYEDVRNHAKVYAVYADGKRVQVTDYSVSNFDSSKEEFGNFKISYNGFEDENLEFSITDNNEKTKFVVTYNNSGKIVETNGLDSWCLFSCHSTHNYESAYLEIKLPVQTPNLVVKSVSIEYNDGTKETNKAFRKIRYDRWYKFGAFGTGYENAVYAVDLSNARNEPHNIKNVVVTYTDGTNNNQEYIIIFNYNNGSFEV